MERTSAPTQQKGNNMTEQTIHERLCKAVELIADRESESPEITEALTLMAGVLDDLQPIHGDDLSRLGRKFGAMPYMGGVMRWPPDWNWTVEYLELNFDLLIDVLTKHAEQEREQYERLLRFEALAQALTLIGRVAQGEEP